VIPITDTPKRIPITLSDTLTLSDTHYTEWYRYPEWLFLSPKVLTTHPRVYPLHWGTLFSSQTNQTLSDTHHTAWFFLTLSDTHWTEFQPIGYRTDGRTHTDSFIYRDVPVYVITMYVSDVQRAAFYEGIGLNTAVGGIWTGRPHRTTDNCEE